MAPWTDYLDNPLALAGYYSDVAGLRTLDLQECVLHCDGPVLRLRADLMRFPDKPSPRWEAAANRAQVTILFVGTDQLQMAGWDISLTGTLDVERQDQTLHVRFQSDRCSFSFGCAIIRLDRITGYCCAAS